MISGEGMKKHVIVKQKHLYTEERFLMFDGLAEITRHEDLIQIRYRERDQKTEVTVDAYDDHLEIKRNGEVITSLLFRSKEKTNGSVLSEFGTIDLGVYTHKYIKKENIIAIEYDILNGDEVSDGYRILWTMKEDIS